MRPAWKRVVASLAACLTWPQSGLQIATNHVHIRGSSWRVKATAVPRLVRNKPNERAIGAQALRNLNILGRQCRELDAGGPESGNREPARRNRHCHDRGRDGGAAGLWCLPPSRCRLRRRMACAGDRRERPRLPRCRHRWVVGLDRGSPGSGTHRSGISPSDLRACFLFGFRRRVGSANAVFRCGRLQLRSPRRR